MWVRGREYDNIVSLFVNGAYVYLICDVKLLHYSTIISILVMSVLELE